MCVQVCAYACVFLLSTVRVYFNTYIHTYGHKHTYVYICGSVRICNTYVHTYLYPGVGANYGWIKGKCADICDVAQVTDTHTLPN